MMKTFQQILDESKSAPLYHGTPFDNVHAILRDGHIKPSDNGRVSTTRSLHSIKHSFGSEAHFVLDQEKIGHRQKIQPTDWSHNGGAFEKGHPGGFMHSPEDSRPREEAEETIKGAVPLKHVKELVVKRKHYDELHAPPTDFEKEADHALKHKTEMAWLYKGAGSGVRKRQAKAFHANLKKHGIKLTIKD